MKNELFVTADGSHSLNSERFGVPYHSVHGAIQESNHVFIEAGLRPLLTEGRKEIRILEMGLGTGLNVLLTLNVHTGEAPEVPFFYDAYELYPLPHDAAERLNYAKELGNSNAFLSDVHTLAWDAWQPVYGDFNLRKLRADFLRQTDRPYSPGTYDLIYYDAFAPASQPELWTQEAMKVCFEALKPGGVLVTYCAKGQFKRDLKAVGFTVEPLPGPPGKREMTRGRKL